MSSLMFLLALSTVAFLTIHADYMEDVTKLLESFERLKGKKDDPLAGLSNFGNNAKEFMKLSRSTGALVDAGVNQQFHPDSEEYKARSKLHKGMETLLDNRIFMGGWSAYDRSEEQEITTTTQVTTTQTEMVPIPGTYLDVVTKLIGKFARAMDEKNNALEELKEVAANSRELFHLAGSVGSLIAAVVNNDTLESDSDELMATKKLHKEMEKYFPLYGDISLRLEEVSVIELFKRQNYQKIAEEVANVYKRMELLMDPLGRPVNPEKRERFIYTCFDKDPADVLIYFDVYYRELCHLPKTEDILLYVRVQEATRNLEWRIQKPYTDPIDKKKYEKVKQRVLAPIMLLDDWDADRYVEKIEKIQVQTYEDLRKELMFLTADYEGRGLICPLELEAILQPKRRDEFMAKIRTVALDLLRIQLLTMTCNGVLVDGDKVLLQQMANTGAPLVEAIGNGVLTWVQHVQNISWPEVSIEAAKKALGSGPLPVGRFNESARIVREELEKHGPEGYSYQVLIAETRRVGTYWSVRAERSKDYASFLDYKGIDCHIFRYKREQLQKTKNATRLFEEKREALQTFLENTSRSRQAATVLASLMPSLNGQPYKSAILLKDQAYFKNNAQIQTGEALWTSSNTTGTSGAVSIEHFQNSRFSMAYTWKLYLFL